MENNSITFGAGKNNSPKYKEIDQLTGLYVWRTFFPKVDEILKETPPATLCMTLVDIEHFHVFNKFYGRDQGDCALRSIGKLLKELSEKNGGFAGYLGGDNFVLLMPYDLSLIGQIRQGITDIIQSMHDNIGFFPVFGICRIENTSDPAPTIYDRTLVAMSFAKGASKKYYSEYSPEMESKLEEELWILTEARRALENEDFTFYIQPQCNISTGKLVGGEALVRWKHAEKGFISPGIFIPVLEKNGLVTELDCYIWKKVCQWQSQMMARGYELVPISINVSRMDIISMNVQGYLENLLKEYNVPIKYLKIEITESAYTENSDKIIKTVKELRDASFLVMMDDFGSGYSSLNMLKNISVDVLKIDMRFLDIKKGEEKKGMEILSSIINMARQLQIPVIVEGVETLAQDTLLRQMNCRYAQGYYYYRPLPLEEFEKLIADKRNLDLDGLWYRQIESLRMKELLDPELFNDIMINNILGAVAFYDVYENQVKIIRVNEQYFKLIGIASQKENNQKFWNNVRDDDRNLFYSIFAQAYANPVDGAQGYIHLLRTDGIALQVFLKVFFLREREGHKIFYGSLTNLPSYQKKKIAEQVTADIAQNQLEQMDLYYGNLPCGFAIARLILDKEGKPKDYEFVYANRVLIHTSGYNMERLRYLTKKLFLNNEEQMLNKAYQVAYQGEKAEFRTYSSISCRYLTLIMGQYQYGYISCMVQDSTHSYIYENALNHALRAFREVYFIHLQDDYCRMIYPDDNHMLERGNYNEVVQRHFTTHRILPQDEENVRRFLSLQHLREVLSTQDSTEYKYRRSVDGVGEEWCLTTINVCERKNGVPKTAVMTIKSIESLMREKEDHKRQNMAAMLANMSDGFFIYREEGTESIIYANPSVLRIFGCNTMQEFHVLTGNTFAGMVHPEDLKRVEWEIKEQISNSEGNMDYILYRIIRKDGQVRWIDDCGHLEETEDKGNQFYVFISDITDIMAESQKENLIRQSQKHNEQN